MGYPLLMQVSVACCAVIRGDASPGVSQSHCGAPPAARAARSPPPMPRWQTLVASRPCDCRSDIIAAGTSTGLADAFLLSHGRHPLIYRHSVFTKRAYAIMHAYTRKLWSQGTLSCVM
jgi:hypothetical protein